MCTFFLTLYAAVQLVVRLAAADFHHAGYNQHANIPPMRRAEPPQHILAPPKHTYTVITPSPGAKPVPVTAQYQVITSYIPQLTLCPLTARPAHPTFPSTPTASLQRVRRAIPSAIGPASYPKATPIVPSQGSRLGGILPPYANLTSSPPSSYLTGTAPLGTAPANASRIGFPPLSANASSIGNPCRTSYLTKRTTVCHTVLIGLATRATVTDCTQLITFSSQYGYTVDVPAGITDIATLPPTAQPLVQTLTTYWEAPWQELTAGVPSHVVEKICSRASYAGAGQECVDIRKGYQTRVVSHVTTLTSTISLSTTIAGPSRLIVATVADTVVETDTTYELQTRVVWEKSTETTVTDTLVLGTGSRGVPSVPATTTVVVTSTAATLTSTSTVV